MGHAARRPAGRHRRDGAGGIIGGQGLKMDGKRMHALRGHPGPMNDDAQPQRFGWLAADRVGRIGKTTRRGAETWLVPNATANPTKPDETRHARPDGAAAAGHRTADDGCDGDGRGKAVGVSRQTVSGWLRDADFVAELNTERRLRREQHRAMVATLIDDAVQTVAIAIRDKGDVKAALTILQASGILEDVEASGWEDPNTIRLFDDLQRSLSRSNDASTERE